MLHIRGTAEIERRVRELAPWFHDMDLRGVRTAPDHPLGNFLWELWNAVAPALPEDMRGTTALDIGCNGGFHTIQLASRGAQVTAIDHNARYLAQARLASEVLDLQDRVELVEMDVYDVHDLGRTFDYVLFMGVLYHLKHPLYALERVRSTVGRRMVFQTMVRGDPGTRSVAPDYPFTENEVFLDPRFPALYFVENRYAGDPTNWWIANDAGAAAMLRSSGFAIEWRVGPGIYVCTPGSTP